MRLDRLSIKRFKNLVNLSIDFDETSYSTVLIGRNATGKSNVLEALVLIFRDLDLGERPSLAYSIRYLCRGRAVEIDADPARSRHTQATVDGHLITFHELTDAAQRSYLPNYVFGYYSGPSNRLEQHFEKHQRRFYQELISPRSEDGMLPLRPLFYTRLVHSQFVLLAYFLDPLEEAAEFLRRYLRIVGLESVLFVMRRPGWANKRRGDQRFWGAVGVVSQFLDRLYRVALAPLRLDAGRSDERLYLFIKDLDALRGLFVGYGGPGDFFKTLESTYISQLIDEVRIRVRIEGAGDELTFRELSEGEQQLLTVLGLLRFTRDDESLFLLDEPDTHLNPAWTLDYLTLVQNALGDTQNSHVILTTHDPLMIGGLVRSQVQILYRDERDAIVRAKQPDEDPKGMGVAALLTSELFGLRSTVDADTMAKLDRKRDLAAMPQLTVEETEELNRLDEELGNLDFTKTVRDPLYKEFVDAMVASGQYRSFKKPVLSPDERRKQKELALTIVRHLTAERAE